MSSTLSASEKSKLVELAKKAAASQPVKIADARKKPAKKPAAKKPAAKKPAAKKGGKKGGKKGKK